MLHAITRIDRLFQATLGAVSVALFVVMIAAVGGQVVMRYVFNSPLSWSEELARYSMVWLAMIASALCARLGQHIAVKGLIVPMPERVRKLMHGAAIIVIAAVLIVIAYHSWDRTVRSSRQTTPGLGLSMSYAYASVPTGSILMIFGLAIGWLRDYAEARWVGSGVPE